MVRCEVRIFDYAIHPFIDFARDIGGPFPVLAFWKMAEQRAVAVFGHLFLHKGDQSFHNLGMQRRIPRGMPLGGAARLPVILANEQEPFARYNFLGIAMRWTPNVRQPEPLLKV